MGWEGRVGYVGLVSSQCDPRVYYLSFWGLGQSGGLGCGWEGFGRREVILSTYLSYLGAHGRDFGGLSRDADIGRVTGGLEDFRLGADAWGG